MRKFSVLLLLFLLGITRWTVAQDECSTATFINFESYSTCGDMAFSNISLAGASPSANTLPLPACGNFSAASNDIWVRIKVPNATNILSFHAFNSDALPIFTAGSRPCMAVYRGASCDNLTLLGCQAAPAPPFGGNADLRWFTINNLVPGETLWARIWDFSNSSYKLFFAASKIQILPEDNCNTPEPLGPGGCNILSTGGDVAAPENCGWSSTDNSIFYHFTVEPGDPQPYTIKALNTKCYGHTGGLGSGNVEIQIAFYKWNGTCASIGGNGATYMGCINGTGDVVYSANLTPGNYVMAIDGLSGTGTSLCTYGFVLPEKPDPNFTPLAGCAGQAVNFQDFSSNAPTSWNWTFSGGVPATSTQQNPTVVFANPGTYSVSLTVTNPYGSSTITQNVVIEAPPVANAGPDQTLCSNFTTLTGNTLNGASYLWELTNGPTAVTFATNNAATTNVNNLAEGTYTFKYTITTANGCTASDNVQVTINNLPTVNAGTDQTICNSVSTVNLSASPATGQWTQVSGPNDANFNNASNANATASGLVVGSYVFRWAATVGNCQAADDVTIAVTQTPTPTIGGTLSYCDGATSSSLVLSPSGGTLTGPGVSNNTFSPAGAGAGTHTLTYTYTDNCGTKTATANVTVIVGTPPTTNLQPVYCINSPAVTLVAQPDGGTWTGNGVAFGFLPLPPGFKFTPSSAGLGTHAISYSIFGGGQCNSVTVQVTVVNQTVAQIAPLPILCSNQGAVALTASPPGGTFSGTGVSSGQFDPQVAGPGLYTITYAGTGACGAYSTTATVNVQAGFNISAGEDASVCADTYTLNAQPSNLASWSVVWQPAGSGPVNFSSTNAHNATISNLSTGTYTLKWATTGACPAEDEVTINVGGADIVPNIQVSPVACLGGSNGSIVVNDVVGGQAPYTFSLNGGAYQATANYPNLTAGNYQLNIKDANGCLTTKTILITQPNVALRFFTTFRKTYTCPDCSDGKFVFSGIGGVPPYSYSINGIDYQSNGVFENLTPGVYILYIRDANGCVIQKNMTLN